MNADASLNDNLGFAFMVSLSNHDGNPENRAFDKLRLNGFLQTQLTDEKSAKPVTACLLSLASNHQAEKYLSELKHQCQQYFSIECLWLSDIILSPDSKPTTTCPIYHNQMALMVFSLPILYHQLHQLTKQLETLAHRHDFEKPIVTLDVDIIAVKIGMEIGSEWQVLARRLPLASYERQGLEQLLEKVSGNEDNLNFLQALLVNNVAHKNVM